MQYTFVVGVNVNSGKCKCGVDEEHSMQHLFRYQAVSKFIIITPILDVKK